MVYSCQWQWNSYEGECHTKFPFRLLVPRFSNTAILRLGTVSSLTEYSWCVPLDRKDASRSSRHRADFEVSDVQRRYRDSIPPPPNRIVVDRKSTRLNSSH